jgi:hypothetical protein
VTRKASLSGAALGDSNVRLRPTPRSENGPYARDFGQRNGVGTTWHELCTAAPPWANSSFRGQFLRRKTALKLAPKDAEIGLSETPVTLVLRLHPHAGIGHCSCVSVKDDYGAIHMHVMTYVADTPDVMAIC